MPRPVLIALTAGIGLTALLFAIFLWLGPFFFLDGRRPFQVNFTLAALAGLVIGIVLVRWRVTVAIGGLRAAALVAIPGMLVMAAVGSHFQVFFPALDPALDKVFGSWMLWFYGFMLIGGGVADSARAKQKDDNDDTNQGG
jgi:MFS superfamily sulfate permease-like transporter